MKNLVILLMLFTLPVGETAWGDDITIAKKTAAKESKVILLTFSGSDWCKPCIQLHQNLFESSEFEAYAEEKLVLLKADFPSRRKNKLSAEQTAKNEALAAKYNPKGEFPLALFLNAEGVVLGTFGFDKSKSAAEYIATFKQYLK